MTSLMPWALVASCAFALGLLAVPPVRRLAWRLGLVDRPRDGAHKSHGRPVPYGGGVAIWLGTVLPVAAAIAVAWAGVGGEEGRCVTALLLCATLLLLLGLADDWRPLSPLPRFAAQLLVSVGLLTACPQLRLQILGGSSASVPATALWMVAVTNAFNFLDNMDGLAAGIAAIALLLLGTLGAQLGDSALLLVSLSLFGAVSAFLVYNFPPATIFMGDAGGFFIGFVISGLSVLVSNRVDEVHDSLLRGLAPLLILAVPIYDQVGVTLIRVRSGVPPWVGDRNHISHRLVELGLSRRGAVLVIHAATLATGTAALIIASAPASLAWGLSLLLVAAAAAVACLDAAARRRQHVPA